MGSSIDDIIGEVLTAAAAGGPRRGNRGTAGYPVPPEMRGSSRAQLTTDDDPVPDEDQVAEDGSGSAKGPLTQKLSHEKVVELAKLVETSAALLKKRGVDVSRAQYVGHGMNGVAFDLGDGRVLKVTRDATEANSSAVIRGKKYENIIRVFDVFRFPDAKLFGIVQEKLTPMTREDKNQFTEYVTDVEVECAHFSQTWYRKDKWPDLVEFILEAVRAEEDSDSDDVSRVEQELEVLRTKFGMDKILAQLKKARVKFRDFHGGNLMWRGQEPVVIDLGRSQSPKQTIDVLETVIRSITEAGPPPTPASRSAPSPTSGGFTPPQKAAIDGPVAIRWITENKRLIEKRGHKVTQMKLLGTGTRGTAVDIGGGKVMKITDDHAEALAANKLRTVKAEHVVRVFDVFRFKSAPVYAVVQELLAKIPGTGKDLAGRDSTGEAAELNTALLFFDFQTTLHYAGYDWDRAAQVIKAKVQADVERKYPKFRTDDIERRHAEAYGQRVNAYWGVLKKFQIPEMTKELSSIGIDFADYHAGNIMKRGSKYILIDLGYSKVTGGEEPDVLERAIREEILSLKERSENYDPGELDSVVIGNADRLKKRGIDISSMTELGRGTRGVAYDVGGGLVLKVTSDESEARASNAIAGKKTERVVRVKDVFRFREAAFYGVVQEKLAPLSPQEASEVSRFCEWVDRRRGRAAFVRGERGPFEEVARGLPRDERAWFLKTLDKYGFVEMAKELLSHGIKFTDYTDKNIMKRGDAYVVIDLGYSVSRGGEPLTLERRLREGKAQSIGLTIGRFQPFHKGHAAIVRNLAQRFTKVVVVVAGNKKDDRNPFSYDLRREMMDLSLPDVEPKVEVYRAEAGGKPTGFLPEVIESIVRDHNSSIEADTAVNVLVGPDRYESVSDQFARAEAAKESGSWKGAWDPSLAVVEKLDGVTSDDEAGRVSGTQVREALFRGEADTVKKLLDPHLSGDDQFEDVYRKLRAELGVKTEAVEIDERISDVGGKQGIDAIMEANAQALKRHKNIDVAQARDLGEGEMGAVYDVGGGRVLKITTDQREARTCWHIRGQKKEHVVHVFDAFQFRNTAGSNVPVFGIVTEPLRKLSPEEAKEFDMTCKSYLRDNQVINTTATKDWPQIVQAIRQMIVADKRKELDLPAVQPNQGEQDQTSPPPNKREARAKALVDAEFNRVQQVLLRFQVDKMVADLRSMNVHFADYHSGNVMKRGNSYVINDIGQSDAPGENPPMLQEAGGFGVNPSGPGWAQSGVKAGSSGWSSPRQMTQGDAAMSGSAATWQDNLRDPNLKMRGSVESVVRAISLDISKK